MPLSGRALDDSRIRHSRERDRVFGDPSQWSGWSERQQGLIGYSFEI